MHLRQHASILSRCRARGIAAEISDQIQEVKDETKKSGTIFSKFFKKDPRFVPVPIPISNPTIGSGLAIAGLYLHPKKDEDTIYVVNTSAKFKDRYIRIKGAVAHRHGPGGERAHEGIAFTTWIDLNLIAKQAGAIAKALIRKKLGLRDTFQRNYSALEKDLMVLDRAILDAVYNGRKFAFCPSDRNPFFHKCISRGKGSSCQKLYGKRMPQL